MNRRDFLRAAVGAGVVAAVPLAFVRPEPIHFYGHAINIDQASIDFTYEEFKRVIDSIDISYRSRP